jgi:hypothetical protein
MTAPTTIRVRVTSDEGVCYFGQVVTYFDRAGDFNAAFQVYRVYEGITVLDESSVWFSEDAAISEFDRWAARANERMEKLLDMHSPDRGEAA